MQLLLLLALVVAAMVVDIYAATSKALVVKIVLSMASGGTGSINADTGITSFDAGITFQLS